MSLIKSMWADIKVDLTIKPLDNAVFTAQTNARTFANMTYWYCGNSAPYKMNDWRPGNPQNAGNIDSPQLVAVYNQLNTLYPFQEDAAMKLVKDQTPYILQQCWEITPPLPLVFWFAQPWLGNYNGEVTLGYYQSENTTAFRWIDQKLKTQDGTLTRNDTPKQKGGTRVPPLIFSWFPADGHRYDGTSAPCVFEPEN